MRRLFLVALAVVGVIGGVAPARAAPPLATYGRLPALEFVRLSPSGDKIAFVAVDGETRRLFVRKVGGDVMLVEKVGESKVRGLEWAGDDLVLVEASGTLKFGNGILDKWSYSTRAEIFMALVVNLKTKEISKVFHHQQAISLESVTGDYGLRQIDGRWYGFFQALTYQTGQVDVYRVDLETGKIKAMTDGVSRSYDYFFGADGSLAARADYEQRTGRWRLLAGERGHRVIATRISPFGRISISGFGRTAAEVLITDDTPTGPVIEEYPIRPDAPATPLFKGLDVESYLRDSATRLLIGAELAGEPKTVLFDAAMQRHATAARKAFPGLQVNLVSASADLTRMVVLTDGGDDPGTYWLVNVSTGKADELTAAYPSLGPKDVGPTRMVSYKAADGLALEGILTLPPGAKASALPLVVFPHGGPMDVHDRLGFDYFAQAFASRGYAVFQPNYRGSSGYGAPLRNAGYGQWGHAMVTDISDGVAALAKDGLINPKRVCIVGASYGGYAALAGVTLQKGIYRCAVSVAGVADVGAVMLGGSDSTIDAPGRYSRALFGVTYAADPALVAISPLRYAAKADAPILLIHGKDDTVVPFVQSASMNAALVAAGKHVEFVQLDGEDHWLSREKTRVETLQAAVDFVERQNPAR